MAHPFTPTPAETSPILKTFGPLARSAGALIRLKPMLAVRFALAPTRAIHAVAIYLHRHKECDTPPEDVASALFDHHPKRLLRTTLPAADPRFYRILDHAALPAWSQSDYVALADVLRSEVADLLLTRGEITPQTVRQAQAILHADPIIRRARHAVSHRHERERLETVVAILNRVGILNDLGEVPEGSRARAVARRVAADFGRAEPSPMEFPIAPGWTRVRRVSDLWQHGTRMQLCLRPGMFGAGDYAVSLLMNRSVFMHHSEANLLAQFREMPAGTWTLAQCVGENNRLASDALVQELTEYVEQAGIMLLPATLGDALDSVLRSLRANDRDDADDGNDDDVGADLAA